MLIDLEDAPVFYVSTFGSGDSWALHRQLS
jgi:hypothetical protein